MRVAVGQHEIRTEIEIRATPERIWSILTDFPAHSRWNPFVKRLEGELRAGATLTFTVHPEGGQDMTFRPMLLALSPPRELRWLGRLLLPGLFDGEHYFLLEPFEPGACRLVHGERFSGLLVSLFRPRLETGTKSGFLAMNRALKARAEAPA